MFNDEVREVEEIESESQYLQRIKPKKIYEDRGSLSLTERIGSTLGLYDSLLRVFVILGFLFACLFLFIVISRELEPSWFYDGSYIFFTLVIVTLAVHLIPLSMFRDNIHGTYYIISEDEIVVVPRNQGEEEEVVNIREISNFDYYEGEVIFSYPGGKINFACSEVDFMYIHTYSFDL